ncbi:proline-rich protein 36 [Galendromus occidentalis]|uniref:Proline-rich protein 36 n=1 Tax=Galendromus occidentalis TaxID=34638 RepID=A0AAJ6QV00_9ACAR|nr:proline-rich protein 36 [Galendromus occidentalis]
MDSIKILCFLCLLSVATAAPMLGSVITRDSHSDVDNRAGTGDAAPAPPVHHVEKRSAVVIHKEIEIAEPHPGILKRTGEVLRMATLLPAKKLQLVRMIVVPLVDQTLALPVNLLEGVANPNLNLSAVEGQASAVMHKTIVSPIGAVLKFGGHKSHALGLHLKHHLGKLGGLLASPFYKKKEVIVGPDGMTKTLDIKTPLKTASLELKISANPLLTTTPAPILAETTTPAAVEGLESAGADDLLTTAAPLPPPAITDPPILEPLTTEPPIITTPPPPPPPPPASLAVAGPPICAFVEPEVVPA